MTEDLLPFLDTAESGSREQLVRCCKWAAEEIRELKAAAAARADMYAALEGAIGALEFSRDYHGDLGNEDQAFAQDKLDAAVAALAKARGQA